MNGNKPSHWRARRDARFAAVPAEPRATQPSLRVDIENLVLSGVARRDAAAVAQAMQAELARLIGPDTRAPQGARRVDAGKMTPSATPERTGRSIGAAVHKALWR